MNRNYDSTTISSSSSSFVSVGSTSWSFKKDQVVKFLKSKRDEYISNDGTNGISKGIPDPDNDHLAYQLSDIPREKAFRSANIVRNEDAQYMNGPPPPNQPFENERIILYPSYSREVDNGYEVDVRGMLYLPSVANKKTRIMQTLLMKVAGVNGGGGGNNGYPGSADLNKLEMDDYLDDFNDLSIEKGRSSPYYTSNTTSSPYSTASTSSTTLNAVTPPPPPPSRHTTIPSTSTTSRLSHNEENTFKDRFNSLVVRSAPDRMITIQIGLENAEPIKKQITTFSNGRFLSRIKTPSVPTFIHVHASDEVNATIEPLIINKNDLDDSKISVITDIDDTIKHTGVTGDKRQILRNVLVRNYEDIAIEGVVDLFEKLAKQGVKFHYVSNSPWQLFSVIQEYMDHSRLPKGSIHLKLYNGLISGLFEPSSEKKKNPLHNIVKDFPDRKFILIGDSGEKDLEAYFDLATQYPNQILAIYIRDVTLPVDDQSLQEIISSTGYIPTPSEIDNYTEGRSSRFATRQRMVKEERKEKSIEGAGSGSASKSITPSISSKSLRTPLSTTPTSTSRTASVVDLIDLSDESDKPALPPRLPPRPTITTTSAEASTTNTTNTTNTTITISTTTTTATNTPNPQHKVPRKPPPPIPQKPQNLRPKGVEEVSTPPPTPPTPTPTPLHISKSEPIIDLTIPPPLPPRRAITSHDPIVMNSEQNDYGQLILDKRVEQWVTRVTRSRNGLPPGVRLKMWRTGKDILEESISLVKDRTQIHK